MSESMDETEASDEVKMIAMNIEAIREAEDQDE